MFDKFHYELRAAGDNETVAYSSCERTIQNADSYCGTYQEC